MLKITERAFIKDLPMLPANSSDNFQSFTSNRIPLVERRPHFEEALARINQRKAEAESPEKTDTKASDSFGAWFEWD